MIKKFFKVIPFFIDVSTFLNRKPPFLFLISNSITDERPKQGKTPDQKHSAHQFAYNVSPRRE